MVGGPGTPFDTSTAVGQADAACRFLQALAAQDGYAQTASTEAPAQRAHLLRAGEAARHVCSLTDSRHSNDQQLRSAAEGCEELQNSATVNVYDRLRQPSRVQRTVTASGMAEQPVPGVLVSSTSMTVEASATTGAMSEKEDTFIFGSTNSATISLPGFRSTTRPGCDGHSKPVYVNDGQVDETDRGSNEISTSFQRSGPGGEAHGVHELPDSEHTPTGRVSTSAERTGARISGAEAAAALTPDPEVRPGVFRPSETGSLDPVPHGSRLSRGGHIPLPTGDRHTPGLTLGASHYARAASDLAPASVAPRSLSQGRVPIARTLISEAGKVPNSAFLNARRLVVEPIFHWMDCGSNKRAMHAVRVKERVM